MSAHGRRWPLAVAVAIGPLMMFPVAARGHDGPPFPVLSDQVAGPYLVSIWTDPDTTDDGSPGGQFWIRVARPGDAAVPGETRAMVTIRPLDREGPERAASTEPVRGDVTNQFAAVVLDHEGRFVVRVVVDGPLGRAAADARVDATYDTRPAPYLLIVYLAPFVLVGVLWSRLLARRRRASHSLPDHTSP